MARKRLNTKFLIALTALFGVLTVGLVGAGWWYQRSPGRAIARAEAAEKEQDWRAAAAQWAAAARRTGNDPQYLMRAIDASLLLTAHDEGNEWIARVHSTYTTILASDPTHLGALQGQMRLFAEDRAFNHFGQATYATREVRRLAGEVLKQSPEDPEALGLWAVATLNLSQFAGETISPDQVQLAEERLQRVVQGPAFDGLAVHVMTRRAVGELERVRDRSRVDQLARRLQRTISHVGVAAERAEAGEWAEGTSSVDRANFLRRLGESYRMLASGHMVLEAIRQGRADMMDAAMLEELRADPAVKELEQLADRYASMAPDQLDEEADLLLEGYRSAYMAYADVLLRRNEVAEAEQVLRGLVERRPWDPQAAMVLANVLQQAGRAQDALQVLRQAQAAESEELPLVPSHAGANIALNRVLLQLTQADMLLAAREESRDPQERERLLNEAELAFERFEGRRHAFGIDRLPVAMRIEGHLLIARNDYARGLALLNDALARHGGDRQGRARVLGLLIDANRRIGQQGAARRHLDQLLELNPDSVPAHRILAEIFIEQNDLARARVHTQRLMEIDPQNAMHRHLAFAATPPEMRETQYAQLPEETLDQKRLKLNAAAQQGRSEELIRLARLVLEESEDPQVALALAQQLAAGGDVAEATELLEQWADRDERARLMLRQIEGGTEGLLAELPELDRLLLEAQIAQRGGDAVTWVSKLEDARRLAPDRSAVLEQLFSAYLTTSRLEEAQTLARELRRLRADGMEGRSYEVRLLLARGDSDQAVSRAQQLAGEFNNMADAHGLSGEALRNAGRHQEAIDAYRRALELSPGSPGILAGMILSHEALGQLDRARPFIEEGRRLAPQNELFRNAERIWSLQYGDPAAVIAQRRSVVEQQPDDIDAHIELGQTLTVAAQTAGSRGDVAEARRLSGEAFESYAAALERFPGDARLVRGLVAAAFSADESYIERAEGPLMVAVEMHQQLEEPDGQTTTIVALAADYWTRRGEAIRAESLVRSFIGQSRDLPRQQRAGLHLMLSELLARQGNQQAALDVLDGFDEEPAVLQRRVEMLATAALANPGDDEIYQQLKSYVEPALQRDDLPTAAINAFAVVEMSRGNFARGEELLERSRQRNPNDPRTLYFLAQRHSREPDGDLNRAASLLQQALRRAPGDIDSLRELAGVQLRQGRRDEAIATLVRLSEQAPQDVPTRLDVINLLVGSNPPRYAEAVRQFRFADEAGVGGDPRILLARSHMEQRRNRHDEAIAAAERAVQAAAGTQAEGFFQSSLLEVLLRAQRFEEVNRRVQAMSQGQVQPPWWARRAQGQALVRLGRQQEALQAMRLAAQGAQGTTAEEEVLTNLVDQFGVEEGIALLRERLEADPPDARDLVLAAQLYGRTGNHAEATSMLVRAQERGVTDPRAQVILLTQLGTLHLQTRPPELEEAISAFRKAMELDPQSLAAVNNLAYSLTLRSEELQGENRRRDLEEAVELGRMAYEIARAQSRRTGTAVNANVADTYGWALSSHARMSGDMRRLNEALQVLRDARATAEQANQPFPEVYYHLAMTLNASRDAEGALEAAEAGLAVLEQRRLGGQEVDEVLVSKLREAAEDAASAPPAEPAAAAGD